MNKFTVTISLVLFTFSELFAQQSVHVFKWEASALNEGSYIGITQTRKDALLQIERLMESQKGTERVADFEIRFSVIEQKTDLNIFEEFNSYLVDDKTYAFLSKEDLVALSVEKKWGRYNSLEYYKNTLKIKKAKNVEKHLVDNVLVFEKFLFNVKKKREPNSRVVQY